MNYSISRCHFQENSIPRSMRSKSCCYDYCGSCSSCLNDLPPKSKSNRISAIASSSTTLLTHLANLRIPVLPWLAKSPDLNTIEHLWGGLERRIWNRPHQPTTLQKLPDALFEEWKGIPRGVWRGLIYSMGRRCRAIIDAYGGHIRYSCVLIKMNIYQTVLLSAFYLFYCLIPR